MDSKIHRYQQVSSTQDEIKRLAIAGASEGTVIVAETQTSGRGRLGRKWLSPPGGLWFSLLLRPETNPKQFSSFSLVLSLAVAEGIKQTCGIQLNLKWPNDLVTTEFRVQSSEFRIKNTENKTANEKITAIQKVGGILIESSSKNNVLEWVIAGIGINVNNPPPDTTPIPAANLKTLAARELDSDKLLGNILDEIMSHYTKFKAHGFACMRNNYMQFMVLKGQEIRIAAGNNIIEGKLIEVDNEGNLMIQSSSTLNKISCGEIIP